MNLAFRFRVRTSIAAVVALTAIGVAPPAWSEQAMSFQRRVAAQEAIERVYYKHRIWPKENPDPKPPFETMVPRSVIEAKVADTLKKSAVLDEYWQRPITARQLQVEMDRMVKNTKDPEMLKELFAALDNDPSMIAECLARSILADRLIRNWYAYDARFHGELKKEVEDLRQLLTPANFAYMAPGRFHAVKIERVNPLSGSDDEILDIRRLRLSDQDFKRVVREYPAEGNLSQVKETAEAFIIRWTERKTEDTLEGGVIVFNKKSFDDWFETLRRFSAAAAPDIQGAYVVNSMAPPDPRADPTGPDAWKAFGIIPESRILHTAVWTGTEMIVWGGGRTEEGYFNTGGRYTPASDTWTSVSTEGDCPLGRKLHTAVWTGTEMIVWGGWQALTGFKLGADTLPLPTPGRLPPSAPTAPPAATGIRRSGPGRR